MNIDDTNFFEAGHSMWDSDDRRVREIIAGVACHGTFQKNSLCHSAIVP